MKPRYRTATGNAAPRQFQWRLWHLLAIFPLAILLVMLIVAGSATSDVLVVLLQGSFVIPILLPAAMLGLALTLPLKTANAFECSPWPDVFRLAIGTALGLGVLSLATLALGGLGLLHHGIPLVSPLLAAAIGFVPTRTFVHRFNRDILQKPITRIDALLLLLPAIPLAVMLIAATFPPEYMWLMEGAGYDVRAYHLELPREYLALGSTTPRHYNVYSYLPANVEMLYLILMSTASIVDTGQSYLFAIYPAQFLHAAMMVLTAVILALAPLPMPKMGRLLALVAFLATPWIVVTGSLAYNDAGMMLFGAVAMALAFAPPSRSVMLAIGVALGLAVGCKLTAGTMFAIPVALILLLQRRFATLALVTLLALLVYAPWAIRAAADSGNPLFPMATKVFGTGHFSEAQARRWDIAHAAPQGFTTLAGRLRGLARESVLDPYWSYLPYGPSATREAQNAREDPREPRRPGPLWLAVAAAMFFSIWVGPRAWILLGVIALQLVCWLLFTHLQARFLLPMLVPMVWIIAMAAGTVPIARQMLGALLGAHALLTSMILIPECGLFLGTTSPRVNAIGFLPTYPAPRDPKARIYPATLDATSTYLLGEATPLYYRGRVFYATVFDRQDLMEVLRSQGPAAARQYLYERKINFLGINLGEIARLAGTYGFEAGQPALRDPAALQAYMLELQGLLAALVEPLPPAPVEGSRGTLFYTITPPPPP